MIFFDLIASKDNTKLPFIPIACILGKPYIPQGEKQLEGLHVVDWKQIKHYNLFEVLDEVQLDSFRA